MAGRSGWIFGMVAVIFMAACGGGGNVGFSGVQDIGQFRAIVESGGIPGPNTLDANGFFNEHLVELPEPDCGETLCLHGMLAIGRDWVYDRDRVALQAAFNTPLDPDNLDPRPHDLVVVVDVSRSMLDDDRLVHVVAGLHLLIDSLDPDDRLGLVAYENEVHVLAGLTDGTSAAELHDAVDALVADGSTNLHGGLETGLEMAAGALEPGRQSQVILLSDGTPTRGETDPQGILYMVAPYAEQGILVATVGIGTDSNTSLLRSIAERAGGVYYFVADAKDVEEVFTEELGAETLPIAYELLLEITPGPGYRLGEMVGATGALSNLEQGLIYVPTLFLSTRTGGREGRRGGGSSLFFQMVPTSGEVPEASWEVARIHFSYRTDPAPDAARHSQSIVVTSHYEAGADPDEFWLSNAAMAKNAAMYSIYMGLRDVTRLRLACAAFLGGRLKARTTSWLGRHDDGDIASDLILLEALQQNMLTTLREHHLEVFVPEEPERPLLPGFCPSLYDNVCSALPSRPGQATGSLWKLFLFLGMLAVARHHRIRRRAHLALGAMGLGITVLLAGCVPLVPSDEVQGVTGAEAIATGTNHSCALDGQGEVSCWGWAYYGQTGSGEAVSTWDWPARVDGVPGITQISAASARTCVLEDGGAVWCWGQAPVGDDTRRVRPQPTRVVDLSAAESVSTGGGGGCAVEEGAAWCWGTVPDRIEGLDDVAAVSAGSGGHSCAVTSDRAARCWGGNSYGKLGDGTREDSDVPVEVGGLPDAAAIRASNRHTCAVTTEGEVWCWGNNRNGEVGHGPDDVLSPQRVVDLPYIVDMALGDSHSCALSTGGDVYCWGSNYSGQLGDGTEDDSRSPVGVYDVEGAVAIAAAGSHACAALEGGSVRCWGQSPYAGLLEALDGER